MDPRFRNALLIALGVGLAFGVGFGWQWTRANDLADRLEVVERDLEFQRLQSTLASAALDARNRGGFEVARQHASRFYSGLQDAMPSAPEEARAALEEILATRDAMITALSRSDPGAADQLHLLLLRWRFAFGEPVGPDPGTRSPTDSITVDTLLPPPA